MLTEFLFSFLPLLYLVVLCGWPLLSFVTLFDLRGRPLTGLPQLLWVLVILLIPIFGAIAYWIVQPKE